MSVSRITGALCAVLFTFITVSASAALIDRGNGLIYDTALDITWLQDANLAASNTFGLPTGVSLGIHPLASDGADGQINADGTMNWPGALHWIDAMNADGGTGYKGYSDWRLPTVSPVNGSSFIITPSSNATTDRGYAPTTTDGTDGGWRDGSGTPVSEMGHMYYVNLANLGGCDPSVPYCTFQTGSGLNNTSFVDGDTGQTVSFDNIQISNGYLTGTRFPGPPIFVWIMYMINGLQAGNDGVNTNDVVWAVRSGDVSAGPDADSDLVLDATDNCTNVANVAQIDTDGDGHGNICDGDFDNDCTVAFLDLAAFKAGFFGSDPEIDLDSDGTVGFLDLGLFKGMFFGTPGPSATGALCNQ